MSVEWSYVRNIIFTGAVDSICLACEKYLRTDDDIAIHLSDITHKTKLKTIQYWVKDNCLKEDCIIKINKWYYCEFCNIVLTTSTKAKSHVSDQTHSDRKQKKILRRWGNYVAFDNVLIPDNSWNALIEDVCALCNVEFDDEEAHKIEAEHVVKLLQSNVVLDNSSVIYRMIDEHFFQCLICNSIHAMNMKSSHFNNPEHMICFKNLIFDISKHEKINDTIENISTDVGIVTENSNKKEVTSKSALHATAESKVIESKKNEVATNSSPQISGETENNDIVSKQEVTTKSIPHITDKTEHIDIKEKKNEDATKSTSQLKSTTENKDITYNKHEIATKSIPQITSKIENKNTESKINEDSTKCTPPITSTTENIDVESKQNVGAIKSTPQLKSTNKNKDIASKKNEGAIKSTPQITSITENKDIVSNSDEVIAEKVDNARSTQSEIDIKDNTVEEDTKVKSVSHFKNKLSEEKSAEKHLNTTQQTYTKSELKLAMKDSSKPVNIAQPVAPKALPDNIDEIRKKIQKDDDEICNIFGSLDYICVDEGANVSCFICDWSITRDKIPIHIRGKHHNKMMNFHRSGFRRHIDIQSEINNYANTEKVLKEVKETNANNEKVLKEVKETNANNEKVLKDKPEEDRSFEPLKTKEKKRAKSTSLTRESKVKAAQLSKPEKSKKLQKAQEKKSKPDLQLVACSTFVRSWATLDWIGFSDVIINMKYCVAFGSFLGLRECEGKKVHCLFCDTDIGGPDVVQHLKSLCHTKIITSSTVVTLLDSEFVRELRPGDYHCGFCNIVEGSWDELENHLKSPSHLESKGNASWRVHQYSAILESQPASQNLEYDALVKMMLDLKS